MAYKTDRRRLGWAVTGGYGIPRAAKAFLV